MSRSFPLVCPLLALALLAFPTRAQDSQSSPPPQSAPNSSTTRKPKKVWTNDNLSDATGVISIVGNPPPPPAKNAANKKSAAQPSVDDRQLAVLREQLQKLEAQLAIVDKQLADLKDFNRGEQKGTGDLRQNTWNYNSSSIDEQIRNLEARRNQIQAAIDAFLDDARKKGIEPGQLR